MELTKEELQRILKWYQAWQAETGSSRYDTDLAYKIINHIGE